MITDLADEFAKEKHSGQIRKISKMPYIKHPEKVAEIIKKNKESHKINELVAAALLHDTLEDTNTNEEELKNSFGKLITELVKELTTDKVEQKKFGKKEYLTNKMKNMSSWALVIKLADRLDNVTDLKEGDKDFKKRYSKETKFILDNLEKERKLSNTHKELIKQIREKINE
jgi:(p)ppGpp synthase/HD superfamily hydrolase